ITRNVNGLCYHHTPVYIGTDTGANAYPDFTNFAHINPDIGDGKTWMLAVRGAALFQEVFVLDSAWSDFVFDKGYRLTPLEEVAQYISEHHHLSGIPSASDVAKNGVSIGETQAKI